jgi:aspartate aminotransferase
MIELATSLNRLAGETTAEIMNRVEARRREGRNVINLGVGQPDFEPSANIIEAAIRALRDRHHGYTPPPGLLALREAVARDIWSRHGRAVDPECVLVLPGCKVGIFLTILMFGEPGAEILHPDPGFPTFRSMIEYTGATAVPIPLGRTLAVEADAVLERITSRTRLLIVNSPANPTGAVMPRSDVDKLVRELERRPGIAVLSDEIYGRIVYSGAEARSWLSYESIKDRVIVLDGWSKTYAMPGWRLGYAVLPRRLMEPMMRFAINSYTCINTAAQHGGIAALAGPQDMVGEMVTTFERRRNAMVEALNAIPGFRCRVPEGAFYVFPNIAGTGYRAGSLQDLLLEDADVATIAGSGFGRRGEGHLRISLVADSSTLLEAVRRMQVILSTQTPRASVVGRRL